MATEIPPSRTTFDPNCFQFRQFGVLQDQCGMKVGTDAIVFAALISMKDARSVFEVGVGTGVVSLILAQRTIAEATQIEGTEIDRGRR